MPVKDTLETLRALSDELGSFLDQSLQRVLKRVADTAPGTTEHADADGELDDINALISKHNDLKLKILDLVAAHSGLVSELQRRAREAEDQAKEVKKAKDRVDQVTSLLDKITNLLGVVSKFA